LLFIINKDILKDRNQKMESKDGIIHKFFTKIMSNLLKMSFSAHLTHCFK
jgi:hypothetical protein